MALELHGVEQAFADQAVLRGLGFTLADGRIGCLLGPSGCGKTTALRCIAGFEAIAGGEIRLAGRRVSHAGHTLAPEKRRVGMVFQDYALLPHLNARDNVAFGLHAWPRRQRRARSAEYLALVGLPDQGRRYPHELSGGQQQRVALARALAPEPRMVLLDEPFSSLDVDLRAHLAQEVRNILRAAGATALLVTHDQLEAFAMADEIGVINGGRIEQWATPYDLYHRPASRFVADFVGQGVLLPGRLGAQGVVETELGPLPGRLADPVPAAGAVEVLLRPDDVVHDDASALTAQVANKAFRGAEILYTLRLESGAKLLALVRSHHDHAIGERIGIRLDTEHIVAFTRN